MKSDKYGGFVAVFDESGGWETWLQYDVRDLVYSLEKNHEFDVVEYMLDWSPNFWQWREDV